MVYRRRWKDKAGKVRHRKSWYFDGRREDGGWEQVCTFTPDKRLGGKMEAMWSELAERHRAWDILNRVLAGELTVARLSDLWADTRQDVEEVRRRLEDVDVTPIVAEWFAAYRGTVAPDTADHALVHVRHFFPEGEKRLASTVTADWLTTTLAGYGKKRNTRRKVHSSVSQFLRYCTKVKRLYRLNPMDEVDRPKVERRPPQFYDLDAVQRIVGSQPTEARRALFALLYGSGVEPSVALKRARRDLDATARELRAPGTKTHTRDRVVRIAEWAWPFVWEHARDIHPYTPIFPHEWNRWTVSDWHRQTVKVLGLSPALAMYKARHHWAVRMLRSGAPVRVVQEQLGHESPQLTLAIYGAFIPKPEDRARAEAQATEYERRREAK